MEKTINSFKQLEAEDFRILSIVEKGMGKYEHVPLDYILKVYNRRSDEVINRLDHLHKLNLFVRWSVSYIGYRLTIPGYDCLALGSLVSSNIIEAFGHQIGVGKESDVYDGLTPSKERVIIKIHRLGLTSFRQIRRTRSYTRNKIHSWFNASRISAEKEYEALKILFEAGISVPRPKGHNRHVVVMDFVEGDELILVRKLPYSFRVLNEILDNVKQAYKIGVVHSDLSEHNVIVKPDLHIVLIDWPQWVKSNSINASENLRRDIFNILHFFERQFGIKKDLEEVLKTIEQAA
ncbi:MAG: RIO1 family regulatory kinase/ATPase [Candidatus Freyarchaeum deiterrae]